MILKEIINKSWYVSNGYVDSLDSIELLEQYILYNFNVLKEFKNIVVATTYKSYPNLVEENKQLWKKYFPSCFLIDIQINRGHSFGIADSENALIDFIKSKDIQWVCKGSNDVLIQETIFNKEIEEADFYYTNGFSYQDLYLNKFNYENMYDNHFFPQTNFYFIRVDKIDYLYDKKYVDETYEYRLTINNYSNKIWEYIPDWSCELFLKKCVERNGLKKYYLLSKEKHNVLCQVVNSYQIGDPSHKNLMIDGVCHFQFPNEPVIEI